jgi:hypothetical protein
MSDVQMFVVTDSHGTRDFTLKMRMSGTRAANCRLATFLFVNHKIRLSFPESSSKIKHGKAKHFTE